MRPTNFWKLSSLTLSALLSLPATPMAQTLGVDFGGNYLNTTGTANAPETPFTQDTGDFDFDGGTNDDARFLLPVANTYKAPLTIDTGITGVTSNIYAGYQAVYVDNAGPVADPSNYKQRGNGVSDDVLQASLPASTVGATNCILVFAPNSRKADFLNGFDAATKKVGFLNAAASVTFDANVFPTGASSASARAMVKNGSSWYVSATHITSAGTSSFNGYTDNWYPYNPDTNLAFNQTNPGTPVAGSYFDDIQAFGVLCQGFGLDGDGTPDNAANIQFQVRGFTADFAEISYLPAVRFGGNYATGNSGSGVIPSLQPLENGDFDGQADGDDRRAFVTFGTNFPGRPDNLGPDDGTADNTSFKHGYQMTYFDFTGADPTQGVYRYYGVGVPDSFQVSSGPVDATHALTHTLAAYVEKANFLNGFAAVNGLTFVDTAGSMVMDAIKQTGTNFPYRAIVQAGSNWYLSGTSSTSGTPLSINGYSETWYPYNPATNLLIPTLSGGVLGSTLTDIQAIGMVCQNTIPAGSGINGNIFRPQGMTALLEGGTLPDNLNDFDAPLLAVTPTIDGTLNTGEWGDAFCLPMKWPALGVLPNVGGLNYGAPVNDADCSANIYLKYDATYLYVGVKMLDSTLFLPVTTAGGKPSGNLDEDHILLCFNPNTGNTDFTNTLSFEFSCKQDGTAAANNVVRNGSGTLVLTNSNFAGSVVTGGWCFEMRLLWSEIVNGAAPKAGDDFGIHFLLFDEDDGVENRAAPADTFLYSAGEGNQSVATTPALYHRVTLGGLQNTFQNWIARYDVGLLTGRGDNPDGGPLDNESEYFFGGDPTVGSDDVTVLPAVTANLLTDTLTYMYNRRIGATALGINYDVQVFDNLSILTDIGGDTETGAVPISDQIEEVTVTIPIDADRKFVRTAASQAP